MRVIRYTLLGFVIGVGVSLIAVGVMWWLWTTDPNPELDIRGFWILYAYVVAAITVKGTETHDSCGCS